MTCRIRAMLLCASFSVFLNAEAWPQTSQPASSKGASSAASLGLSIGDARAIVLYFIASDCPISNRLLPEMLHLEREFTARRVRFFFVYPNTTESSATIHTHRLAYGIEHKTLTDPHATLAKLTGANVTPEAAVLIRNGATLKSVYTGRIDDRYLSLGTERPAATRHDLEDAITAVLADHPVPPPGGPPVGCAFMNLSTK